VFDGAQVEDVLFGTDGVVGGATPGTVVCVCSTVEPDAITDFSARAAPAAVHVIDAGVAGGYLAAAKGQLVTTVGGEPAQVEAARPVLDAFSKEVIHAGPLGAGLRVKLLKNHLSYLAMFSVTETLILAEELGISAATIEHLTRASNLLDDFFWGPMARPSSQRLGPDADANERERAAHFAQTARKDLSSVEALASGVGVDLPMARTARRHAGRFFLAAEMDDPAPDAPDGDA
jgi:3-hydroxyisobutyrate dehydrogenase-like beta-hydroxyacid dehydrogenase